MWLEKFILELQDFGEKDDEVFIRLYACGKAYEVPMTHGRIHFSDGKVIIVVDDN